MPFRKQSVNELLEHAKKDDPVFEEYWVQHEEERALRSDLIALRQAKGFTQHELAMRCGVSQQLISRIENGENSPTLRTLCKILAVLGYHIEFVPDRNYPAAEDTVLKISEELK